ncbi:MAG: heavy metal translocating P-type ATPase, partial [Tepidiformaceae bacterium]
GYTLAPATDFRAITARGASATVNGRAIVAGNPLLFEERAIDLTDHGREELSRLQATGRTAIVVAIDGAVEGVIGIADEVKANAARSVAALRRLGLRVIMMTGDNAQVAAAVAAAVGIEETRANARPEDKLALVRELQAQGLSVAMVGDGINDAPALAQAEVGIAMSTGTDVAIEAGDITLLSGDVSKIAEAISLSRSTLRTIRQNLVWAFGYNVLALPIAASGLLNPILAGAAMALSSVSVMGNSLRLRSKARAIAESSGNSYRGPRQGFVSANRGPLFAMTAAAAVLVLPLSIFTAMDRGWFDGADALGAREVRIELRNWEVEPSRTSIEAGAVTFRVVHAEEAHGHGSEEAGRIHDLVVLRRNGDGSLEMVARTPALKPGEDTKLSVTLSPGDYELQCSIVEEIAGETIVHVAKGMEEPFVVT